MYILGPKVAVKNSIPDIVPRKFVDTRLLHLQKCFTTKRIVPYRDNIGNINQFVEVGLKIVGASGNNSLSMRREPGNSQEVAQASAVFYPFWPGGFGKISQKVKNISSKLEVKHKLLAVPPGFIRGYEFKEDTNIVLKSNVSVNLLETLDKDLDVQNWLILTSRTPSGNSSSSVYCHNDFEDLDEQLLLPDLKPVLNISDTGKNENFQSEWAEMIDISQPMDNFEQEIPVPAMIYPFNLDVFQKQAILKLEKRQYVFVAAHTSAGIDK